MKQEIKDRLDSISRGEVPEGYSQSIAGITPQEWTCMPLSEIAEILSEQAGTRDLETMSISAGIGFVNQAEKFGKEISGNQYAKYTVLRRGDFAYNKGNSKRYPQGCTYMLRERDEAAVPNVFECFRIVKGVPEFYEQLFVHGFMNRQLSRKINHGVRDDGLLNLTDEEFYNTVLPVPPIAEQQKIAEILSTCDKVIELKKKLLEETQKLKSVYLSKMFPVEGSSAPEMRFAGFTGDWKRCKLGQILQTQPFKQYLKNPETNGKYVIVQQGDRPVIGYGNGTPCTDYLDVVIFGDHTLSLYKPCAPFFVASDGVRIIKGSNGMNGSYLMALLTKFKPQPEGYKRYYSILANVECYITENAKEQEQIGTFFRQVDDLITVHQHELEAWKQKKKALMHLLLTGLVCVNA